MNDRVPFQNDTSSDTNIPTSKQDILDPASTKAGDEKQPETPERTWEGKMGPLDDINYHRMADVLGVDYESRKASHIQEKIAFLTDWAKQETKSDDRLTQALAIKDLSRRLGWNLQGKEMLTKLHKWVYLDLQRKRIEMQQEIL